MPTSHKPKEPDQSDPPASPESTPVSEKPKVWPASAADLGIDEPPIAPDEPFTYLPDTALDMVPGDTRNVDQQTQATPPPPKLGKQRRTLEPSFSAILRVDGEVQHFDVSATGSPMFVERMMHAFADAFIDESREASQ